MFSFFKKSSKPDTRDLEQVLFDLAQHRDEKDFGVLFARMKGRHVFVPADPGTFPAGMAPGAKYVTKPGDRVSIATVTGPNGDVLAVAATEVDAGILKSGFLRMDWADFMNMVRSMDASIKGALLQGKTSWVVLDRQRIKTGG